jgi:putative restriction endonuclease
MHGTVAVTDYEWYRFLLEHGSSEVNFWMPLNRNPIRAAPFSPFFFKLKAPHNAICGFGYFSRWAYLPDWFAWECFEKGNGCSSLSDLQRSIVALRRGTERKYLPGIGCIILAEPTFFPPEAWIPQPSDWSKYTVSRKGYDLTTGEGRRIWEACQERVAQPRGAAIAGRVAEVRARYGEPRLIAPRLGQGTFRIAVTDAYQKSCAVTGESSWPVLEAAHIRSFADEGPHEVCNGVLLRADLHRLFDKRYITITPQLRIEVSKFLREHYHSDGYDSLHGTQIRLPKEVAERPALEYIRWHNERYLG